MRKAVTLESDVAAAVQRLRREAGVDVSEAVNRLIRAGLAAGARPPRYVHQARDLGLRVDVPNVGDIVALLDDA